MKNKCHVIITVDNVVHKFINYNFEAQTTKDFIVLKIPWKDMSASFDNINYKADNNCRKEYDVIFIPKNKKNTKIIGLFKNSTLYKLKNKKHDTTKR